MAGDSGWWLEFFAGQTLDFVRFSRDAEQTHRETGFILQAMDLPVGANLLDVPCGAGRLSLELTSWGYEITGVDISQPLLESARDSAEARGVQVTWANRDMRDLPWQEEFDGAFCAWSSFGYFDEQGNADFLKAVARSLKRGAPFVLDTPLIETRLPEITAEPRVWWPVGDLLALEERSFDHETSRVESRWTFIRDGTKETKHLSLRLYTYRELAALLEQAGFGNHEPYGGIEFEPFGLGSEWLYLVTKKL